MQQWLSRLAAGYSASPIRSPGPMWARGTMAIALTLTYGERCPAVTFCACHAPEARPDRNWAQRGVTAAIRAHGREQLTVSRDVA